MKISREICCKIGIHKWTKWAVDSDEIIPILHTYTNIPSKAREIIQVRECEICGKKAFKVINLL